VLLPIYPRIVQTHSHHAIIVANLGVGRTHSTHKGLPSIETARATCARRATETLAR
jgi:hypothetical protein